MDTPQRKYWKVLLVGDHCTDVYHFGTCSRLSPEAPVPVLKETRMEKKMGMSSNVKLNLRAFGINVAHHHNTEKIEKHRIVDERFNHQLLRYDVGEQSRCKEFNPEILEQTGTFDAVVISDYNKGFLGRRSIQMLCDMYSHLPIFVDSKNPILTWYSGCILKVNEKEFKNINKMPKDSAFVVTLGEKGALYENKVYETQKTDVFDVCGAGDVFLSALVYGWLKTENMPQSIQIANKCASYSVSKVGTYVLSPGDINDLCV